MNSNSNITPEDRQRLHDLGKGTRIIDVCAAHGLTRPEFDAWWQQMLANRNPASQTGRSTTTVGGAVTIHRDRLGIPRIEADNDQDLFLGFGYAMAQDRLFQLDYLRRKGLGRLAEILGVDGLAQDKIARTVGLNRIAANELERLDSDVRQVLEAFSAGINACITDTQTCRPIEFDLLNYTPEPWTPRDCLAIETEFRWYLTGRFPIIAIPELARRTLGDGPLYDEFVTPESDAEPILWPGEYPANPLGTTETVGQAMDHPDAATGSNNWVIAGRRTTSGLPLIASDPHIAFEAVSCWYEAHLCGGQFQVAGMAYVGIPAIMFGRNTRVAWGITNNICSQRDLYQEQTDPGHPDAFLYDGQWEPAREFTEVISIRDEPSQTLTVRCSRNGPVVDEILPPAAQDTGPVTIKWLGAYQGGWLTALLGIDRASDVPSFRAALRPWHVPTFSMVVADVEGNYGFQASGRIPIRNIRERGYRPGWDPQHQWQGLIPFEDMPHLINPERDWIASANNRLAPDDFPYPLSGCWNSGWRASRIRQMIEAREQHSVDDMREMHQDARSLRAADHLPGLLAALENSSEPQLQQAREILAAWDCDILPDAVAPTLFNVFFTHWCREVASERFADAHVELVAAGARSCAGRLLHADTVDWFAPGERVDRIQQTMLRTISELAQQLGPDMTQWTWGRLHVMPLKHVLSERGDLAELLDHGGAGVRGDMWTVCNTGAGVNERAATGAGYRMIADLSTQPPSLFAVDAQSQSGHPGSPHYTDQYSDWLSANYHEISLQPDASSPVSWTLEPAPR